MNIETEIKKMTEDLKGKPSVVIPQRAATPAEIERALAGLRAHAESTLTSVCELEMELYGHAAVLTGDQAITAPPQPLGTFNRFAYMIVDIDRLLARLDARLDHIHELTGTPGPID